MSRIIHVLLIASLLFVSASVSAIGTFINAPNRIDMVHDSKRDLIYISNGDSLLRYHVPTASFLSPIVLGGTLSGIDLSPDQSTLAVANYQFTGDSWGAGNNWVHLINLDTGAVTNVNFSREYGEGGTYTVAYGADGQLLITSRFNGSGWVPLRRLNPVDGTSTKLASVRQDTMLTASGDANVIAFVEANISSGPVGKYLVPTQALGGTANTNWYTYEVGVNQDGTHFSVPTYGGTFLFDGSWNQLGSIGQYAGPQPIGVVYHPVENLAYYPWTYSTEVRAYDTTTMAQVASYDFEYSFSNNGNWAFKNGRMKISRDGSLLMGTVASGLRIVGLYVPLSAADISIATPANTAVTVTLQGSIGNGGALSYRITKAPDYGVLTGDAPNLTYLPNPNFTGSDSFSYEVHYGRAVAAATASISVTNEAPIARDDTYRYTNSYMTLPVLENDSDPDGDNLVIISITPPTNGEAQIVNGGQAIQYSMNMGRNKQDQFIYTVSDGRGASATATVFVTR